MTQRRTLCDVSIGMSVDLRAGESGSALARKGEPKISSSAQGTVLHPGP